MKPFIRLIIPFLALAGPQLPGSDSQSLTNPLVPPRADPAPAAAVSTAEPVVAYLAAYMTGSDERHLYYAVSTEGFRFDQPVKGGKPILSANFDDRLVRDPMVFRDEQGTYRLVATVSWSNRPFTLWDSTDLVNWTNERLVDVAPPNATKTWAPEIAYDREQGRYFVYWTGETGGDWDSARIYCATTTDFRTFSAPQVLFADPRGGILDANIVHAQGVYHLYFRFKGVWKVTSANALGPYADPVQVSAEDVEGPYLFPLRDRAGWGLVWDYFGGSQGWGLFTSDDLQAWRRVTNPTAPFYNERVWFPAGIRHGSIIPLTQAQLDRITRELGMGPPVTR